MKHIEFSSKNIYIMPFSIPALFLYHVLKRNNVKVADFFDNDIKKSGGFYDGKQITLPHYSNPDVEVILITLRYEREMKEQLLKMRFVHIKTYRDILDCNFDTSALEDIHKQELEERFPYIAAKLPLASQILDLMRIPYEIHSRDDAFVIFDIALSVTQKRVGMG